MASKRIAVLGATSHIARDYIQLLSHDPDADAVLFSRDPHKVERWLTCIGAEGRFPSQGYEAFRSGAYDAIINFIGVGDAAQMARMGAEILEITNRFDQLVLDYLHLHPTCRYLFLSSGGVYGGTFPKPADADTLAVLSINKLIPQEFYILSKLYAEYRHRALPHLAITDIRVFNYFSRTQDLEGNYFICILLRAIMNDEILQVTDTPMVRDYIGPQDFHQLTKCILSSAPTNQPIDCYSQAPVEAQTLLHDMQRKFGLKFAMTDSFQDPYRSLTKQFYYSNYKIASQIGYEPSRSSLQNIMTESAAIFDTIRNK